MPRLRHAVPGSVCFVLPRSELRAHTHYAGTPLLEVLRRELRAHTHYASTPLLEVRSQSLVFAFEARSELPMLISSLQSSALSREHSWDSR